MNPELENKINNFLLEQIKLMEEFMGPFALQHKAEFGNDIGAYYTWLNMAYQFKSILPSIDDQKITPEALKSPLNKSPGFKF